MKDMTRSKRRAWYNTRKKKVRLIAEQRYQERLNNTHINYVKPIPEYIDFYRGNMINDGHWMNGGCSKVNCGLCQPYGLSFSDLRKNKRMADELKDWKDGQIF